MEDIKTRDISGEIYLILLAIFVSIISYYRFSIQRVIGPGWDTYAFLANGLQFAGRGIGYEELLSRPPFLSFLYAIFFKMGFTSEFTIFAIDAFLSATGVIGLFLLFRLRFSPTQSFIGTLFFASFPVILQNTAIGITDLPSLALSIWAIYFFVLAIEKNSRYYLLAWPFFMLALLTRFTAGLILFPIIVFSLLRTNFLQTLKDNLSGLLLSILTVFGPYLLFYHLKYGDALYQLMTFFGTTVSPSSNGSQHPASTPSFWYYLINLPSYLAKGKILEIPLGNLLIPVMLFGLLLFTFAHFTFRKPVFYHLALTGSALLLVAAFKRTTYPIIIILLCAFCFFLNKFSQPGEEKENALDILFLAWLGSYLIFHSKFDIKVDRYWVTMAPGFAYLTILGWNETTRLFASLPRTQRLLDFLIAISFGGLIVVSLVATLPGLKKIDPLNPAVRDTARWLKLNQKDIGSAKILSDTWPHFSWYLKQDVKPMPPFNNPRLFEHELLKYHADYYLSTGKPELSHYQMIYTQVVDGQEMIFVYKKSSEPLKEKPRFLYIGRNWEHYIEDVLGFKAFVIRGESEIVDDYDLKTLQAYSGLLLYNFKWRSRERMERFLTDYAKAGGKIIVDATANLDGPYNLDQSTFLGGIVTKKNLPPNPRIEFSNDSLLALKKTIQFSSFLSEGGGSWSGTTYQSAPGTEIKNLVTANGDLLLGIRKVGRGQIYWMGYNLVWHSFITRNKKEQGLIRNILLGET